MNEEIKVLEDLVGAMLKAKDLIDNHSQTEIETLKAKCVKEKESIKESYLTLTNFFNSHWNELKGSRLNGGIWKNDYLSYSPMYFGSWIELICDKGYKSVNSVRLNCDAEYDLKKRNNIVHTPSHPYADSHSVTTIDYWTEEWEALKWDRKVLEETIRLIKKELTRLVNNQLERFNNANSAINENVKKISITITF